MNKPKSTNLQVMPTVGSDTSLKERRDRILTYHTGFTEAFAQQAGYAYLCGIELNAAKEQIGPRGGFIDWHKENLPLLSNGSVHRYMLFAERMQTLFPTVGNITSERLQLTEGRLHKEDQTLILQAVHEAADGSSLTELYRELGVIKKPTARAAAPGRKDLSPAEAVAAEKAAAVEYGRMILADLAKVDDKMRANWPADLREQLSDAFIEQGNALRNLKKGRMGASPVHAGASPAPSKKGSK